WVSAQGEGRVAKGTDKEKTFSAED
ncbi:MAG: hypothetical protein ACI8R9_001932, partial [Paraglaciecola sp.]